MPARTKISEQVEELSFGVTSYEVQAQAVFKEAQRAAALIPIAEFEDVLNAAPEMEYHHRYVQSILTWVWYEVNEHGVPLDNLPDILQGFYKAFEEPFAKYWM
jgi:hypothetical protein